jgi:hypothetical protein
MAPVVCPKCDIEQENPPSEAEQMHCEKCESVIYIEREDEYSTDNDASNPFPISNDELAKLKARVDLENGPLAIGRQIQSNSLWGTLIVILGSAMTLSGFIGDDILYFPFFGGIAFLYGGYKLISSTNSKYFVALEDGLLCLSPGPYSPNYLIPLSRVEDWLIVLDRNDHTVNGKAIEETKSYQLLIGVKDDYPITVKFDLSGIEAAELQRVLDMANLLDGN